MKNVVIIEARLGLELLEVKRVFSAVKVAVRSVVVFIFMVPPPDRITTSPGDPSSWTRREPPTGRSQGCPAHHVLINPTRGFNENPIIRSRFP